MHKRHRKKFPSSPPVKGDLGGLFPLKFTTTMNNYLKEKGRRAEQLIASHYAQSGHRILHTNYTIHGGELDIVAENADEMIFIEVKAVDRTNDLHEYITPTKLSTLQRTIENYLRHYPSKKPFRLDVAFVKENSILCIYKNVTNN